MESAVWYVAATLSRAEGYAEANLGKQGFPSFCPRFFKTRRHARRIDKVLVPLFPGYIFVRFDRARDPWRSINGTRGVASLIGTSSTQPQPMPNTVMEMLFNRCDNGVMRCILPELSTGQKVRLLNGPFSDRIATIEQFDDKGRVRVLLDLLGSPHSVRIGMTDLAPV